MPHSDPDKKRTYAREYMRKRRSNPEYRAAHAPAKRAYSNAYYAARKNDSEFVSKINQRTKDQNRRYYADSDKRERMLAASRRWKKRNPGKVNALNGARVAAQISATPRWADFEKIEETYVLASQRTVSTGIAHEVDHIVPLISDLVCGLHVHENLRVISQSANRSKGNRF